ncbi:uncharacterized protein LOC133897931 [Phragmites australis]|uniref:uncharacterized protein LOC133897931 n=1 Tax=Phragmites australis TaxID=29695 RepID=UPI002D7758B8|nr:uncharacterized protein LOC133897931 [Phragmites australis]
MAGDDELLAGGGGTILPPRLEDAGLEDCALPPESIAEAFSLAAMAVSSRLGRLPLSDSDEEEEECLLAVPRGGGCVDDAGRARGAVPDALITGGGGDGGADEVLVVGGGDGGGSDKVVVSGRGEEEDRVVVVGEGRGKKKLGKDEGCVEGVREGVGEPAPARGEGDDEKTAVAAEKAILVPDFA